VKYIVTGGAGFIGSHIAAFLARDHEVVILDNLFSGKEENIRHLPVRFVQGSVTDLPLLRDVFDGARGVFPGGHCIRATFA
jgi:UDP-glucose 4-epimerase